MTRREFIQASAATSGLLAAGCATQPPVSSAMAPRKMKGGSPAQGMSIASTCQGCTQWCAIQIFGLAPVPRTVRC
ncbi:MAG: twin-arginine translocation signal domain-containing protein [Burkholderiaceae bacterium]